MSHNCEIIQQGLQPVILIRTHAAVQDMAQVIGQSFAKLGQYLSAANEDPSGPPFVAYHNMDMSNLEIEIGFPVAKSLPGQGEVKPGELPAGRYAACLHSGPYQELGKAYDALTNWVAEQGLEPTGVAYEYYLNDPEVTAPEALQTRIVFPLR